MSIPYRFQRLLFLFFTTLLIACSNIPPTPAAQLRPTNQSTPTTNNPTPITKPTTTPITELIPSNTPSPPIQLTATQIITPTITSTPTPTSTPTHRVVEEFVSANGKWTATVEVQFISEGQEGDINDIFLLVRNIEEGMEWLVESRRAEDWISNSAHPQPLHFSKDDQYLYYTHAVLSDGCASSGPYSDLLRFNLATGETTEVVARSDAYNYIVAPDGDEMAIIMDDGLVSLYDLSSGTFRYIQFQFNPEPRELNMDLFWSPDSQHLMVEADIDVCYLLPLSISYSYIYRIDATTLEKTLLLHNDGTQYPSYDISGWPETDLVLLSQGGVTYYMNPWTGEVTAELVDE